MCIQAKCIHCSLLPVGSDWPWNVPPCDYKILIWDTAHFYEVKDSGLK